MRTAYRIVREKHAATIWSGIGAREYGGRWSSKGSAVVYAAESRSLAALEQLVHLIKPAVLRGFVIASITFDSGRVQRIDPSGLPPGWGSPVAPSRLRGFGDEWLAAGKWPVLAVPSAVVRGEWNYLFDPAHSDFARMPKSAPEPFAFDARLR